MKTMPERIKTALTIREVMEHYGVQFSRRGFALCPFHTEKTPSLSIKNERFTCFGCGASGDVIDFVRMYFGINFGQAVVRLNNDFNLGITGKRPKASDVAKNREERRLLEAERQVKEMYLRRYMAVTAAYRKVFRLNNPNLKKTLERLEGWLDENIEMG